MFAEWWQSILSSWLEHWVAWAIFAGYLAATLLVAWLSKGVLRSILHRATARSTTTLDDRIVTNSLGPIRFIILAVGLRLGLESLGNGIPSIGEQNQFKWVLLVATAILMLSVASLVNGIVKAVLDWYLHELAKGNNATWDDELLPVVRRLASLVIYFIALSIVLDSFGVQIAALVTTAGVASLAVALAAQDTIGNMLGGFSILVDRPFRVGDVIELADGKAGEVVEIGLRSTRIRQFDGNALIMPNKDMANSRVINYALPNPRAAIRQTIGVAYGVDIEKAKQVLLDVIQAHPEILKDPAPGVWFNRFGASSLDLFMSAWVESYRDRFRITDELNIQILKAFRENGIEIPFTQQDVHLHLKQEDREALLRR